MQGSKNYKYKGVLDRIATRAYSVTNAWTATDHTAYTLDTAGWESFAQIVGIGGPAFCLSGQLIFSNLSCLSTLSMCSFPH
jgi:hypothetical protein